MPGGQADGEPRLPDRDLVAIAQRRGHLCREGLFVEHGAIGAAEIGDRPGAIGGAGEAGVVA